MGSRHMSAKAEWKEAMKGVKGRTLSLIKVATATQFQSMIPKM